MTTAKITLELEIEDVDSQEAAFGLIRDAVAELRANIWETDVAGEAFLDSLEGALDAWELEAHALVASDEGGR